MLLKITNYCRMNCTHCSEDAGIDGQHMSVKVFADTLNFINKLIYKPSVLLVTGGEPTEHPAFIEFMDTLKKNRKWNIVVTSNGMFLDNEGTTNYLKSLPVQVQITNDQRYYPQRIKHIEAKNFYYEYNIRHVAPFGRAVTNNIPINRGSPFCFNFRSIHTKTNNFNMDIAMMEKLGKFCTPTIDIQGNILLGEMASCYVVGTIYDSIEKINANIASIKCNKCKLYDKLGDSHKITVGEMNYGEARTILP